MYNFNKKKIVYIVMKIIYPLTLSSLDKLMVINVFNLIVKQFCANVQYNMYSLHTLLF